mmetsp:Transcript_7075/g.11259  ORF Transcript_7075/g.11259 Transcript_7075/m.11259 type:complete len:81 (+) Transcript_7075:429-671(+)
MSSASKQQIFVYFSLDYSCARVCECMREQTEREMTEKEREVGGVKRGWGGEGDREKKTGERVASGGEDLGAGGQRGNLEI